jgi:NADH-quinone oxidoreductase subunit N
MVINKSFFINYLLCLSLLAIYFIINSFNFISFYISLELFSFCSIFLLYYNWSYLFDSFKSISIIYFLINALSSIILLLNILYLFIISNSFNFNDISIITMVYPNSYFYFLFIPFFIKLAIVPFHFWAIPLYEILDWKLTLFQSIIPKIIYLFILHNFFILFNLNYNSFLLFFSILSLFYGSFLGLKFSFFKSILGSSSILNMGFLIMVLNHNNLYLLLLLYFIHIFPIFFIFLFYPNHFNIKYLYSLFNISPWFSLFFSFLFLSLIGIPPFAGFYFKLFIFSHNFIFPSWIFSAILSTLFSTIFYLNFLKELYSFNNSRILNLNLLNNFNYFLLFSLFSFFIIFFIFFYPYIYFIL